MFQIQTHEDAKLFVEKFPAVDPMQPVELDDGRKVHSFHFTSFREQIRALYSISIYSDGTWKYRVDAKDAHAKQSTEIHDPVEFVWEFRDEINRELREEEPFSLYPITHESIHT